MKLFALSDLHLSLTAPYLPGSGDTPCQAKPMDCFGPGWADFFPRLEAGWCGAVGEEDTVLIAGDISWGLRLDEAMADLEWIHGLPGHKVIIKGNHDLWWTSIGKLNGLYEDITFLQNHCYEVPGTGIAICGTRGWI